MDNNGLALKAFSMERYNGGIAVKRQYGSSTVTKFLIEAADGRSVFVKAFGKTPGERKTFALREATKLFAAGRVLAPFTKAGV